MPAFSRVMQIAPGTLCALVLVRSLDQPIAQAQLVPASAATSEAGPRSGPPARGEHRGPPPVAYEACAEKDQGDDCSVAFGDRTLAGSCVTGLDDKLFCLPDEMPPPPPGDGRGPPPEAPRLIDSTL
jgi:hypothetical protein